MSSQQRALKLYLTKEELADLLVIQPCRFSCEWCGRIFFDLKGKTGTLVAGTNNELGHLGYSMICTKCSPEESTEPQTRECNTDITVTNTHTDKIEKPNSTPSFTPPPPPPLEFRTEEQEDSISTLPPQQSSMDSTSTSNSNSNSDSESESESEVIILESPVLSKRKAPSDDELNVSSQPAQKKRRTKIKWDDPEISSAFEQAYNICETKRGTEILAKMKELAPNNIVIQSLTRPVVQSKIYRYTNTKDGD